MPWMPFPIYVPSALGYGALVELDRVQWKSLEHAYTGDQTPGGGLHKDVYASLRALGDADPHPALHALFSNVYHQRTVYEATAYALPFLAAVAAEPAFEARARLELVNLVVAIALSSTFTTDDGTCAGAYGEGTDDLIRAALVKSEGALRAAARIEPLAEAAIPKVLALAIADPPTKEMFDAARDVLTELEHEILRRAEARPSAQNEGPPVRYRHAKFGDAVLLSRDEGKLRLQFDDGTVRVLQDQFVTRL